MVVKAWSKPNGFARDALVNIGLQPLAVVLIKFLSYFIHDNSWINILALGDSTGSRSKGSVRKPQTLDELHLDGKSDQR